MGTSTLAVQGDGSFDIDIGCAEERKNSFYNVEGKKT